MASKLKISPDKPKATFLRKSAFLTTGDNSFRFNFDLAPEQVDNGNTSNEKSAELSSIDGNNKRNEDSNTGNVKVDNSNKFKFSFSDSQFKFNFTVDN